MEVVAWLVAMRIVGAVTMGAVAIYALRNRDSPGAESLIVLGGGVVIWLFSDMCLLFTDSVVLQQLLLQTVYTGVVVTVVGWGYFAIEFTGYGQRSARLALAGIAIGALLDVALIWTNPFHGEFFTLFPAENVWGIKIVTGTAFLAHVAYAYVVIVSGIALLVILLFRSQSLYQGQIYGLIGAITVPWGADIAFQLSLVSIELTPLAITVAGLLLATTVFRFKFMTLSPVAQDTIIENIRDGVVVVDRDGTVVDTNEQAATLFETTPERMRRNSFGSYVDVVPGFEKNYGGIDDETVDDGFEFEHGGRYFDVRASTLEDHHDRIIGRQLLLHEVTQQRRYQEQLERQNEQLDQFASVVSHDLRNPLEVATSNLELAREQNETDRLDVIADAHDRMETLISEMLNLARHGQRVTETRCLSLADVAQEAWDHVETEEATLSTGDPIDLYADRERLLQLFENLFRNAVQHAGPDVTVRVGRLDSGFYVEDDGPGIPETDRETVFDSSVTTAEDGTGLGLFITKSIVTAHNWSITVTDGPDGGARFEVRNVESCDRKAASGTWADREWVAGPERD